MSKHHNHHKTNYLKPISEDAWGKISPDTLLLKPSEICDRRCKHYVDLSQSTRKWNKSLNDGKCNETGGHLCEGSNICVGNKEIR